MDNEFCTQLRAKLKPENRIVKLKSALLTDNAILTLTFLIPSDGGEYRNAKADVERCSREIIPSAYDLICIFRKTMTSVERVKDFVLEYIYKKSAVLFPRVQNGEGLEVSLEPGKIFVRFVLPPDLYAFMETNAYGKEIARYLDENFMETPSVELISDRALQSDAGIKRKALNSIRPQQGIRTIKINVKENVIGTVSRQPRYLGDCKEESASETVCGKVSRLESRVAKSTGRKFFLFRLDDTTGEMPVKFFTHDERQAEKFENAVCNDALLAVEGPVQKDQYSKELSIIARKIGICDIDYSTINNKIEYLDINEDYVVIAPKPYEEEVQATMFDEPLEDDSPFANTTYVVFDLETTGLNAGEDRIIEIGAVKMIDGKITEYFSTLVNPEMHIPEEATKKNNITDEMVADAPRFEEIAGDFCKFCYGAKLVAHNAPFDLGFLTAQGKEARYYFDAEGAVDTLQLARSRVLTNKYNLGALCKLFHIELIGAHRAYNDAAATAKLFKELMKR